jgi:hypothetical protein
MIRSGGFKTSKMTKQPGILRSGNKFRTNMTSLEFLKYSKTHEHTEHDVSYYKPKRDENGDPVKHYNGSATAVKGLRVCFQNLMDYTDSRFTGRLMKIATEIYRRDSEGEHCKKSVYFSRERGLLGNFQFNVRVTNIDLFTFSIWRLHSEDRTEATLTAKDFYLKQCYVPTGTTHFRILHHLSIISDFAFSEYHQCYEPLNKLSGMSAIAYSGYTPVGSVLNEEIKVPFPIGTVLSEDDSVIQCVGVEFSMKSGDTFLELKGSGVMVVDVY